MEETVTIARRFRGPAESGNGGYTCGVFAAALEGPAEVTLRLPPPLEVSLSLERADGAVRYLHDGAVVAEAAPTASAPIEAIDPVSFDGATAASQTSWIVDHPEDHPFEECFVCGPARAQGDGLRVFVGPVPGRDVTAAPWVPDGSLPVDGDRVAPEIVWAVLDCAGGIGSGYVRGERLGLDPHVLGRMTVDVLDRPRPGDRCVVLGWQTGREGRKVFAGSALQSEDGRLLARARATWIKVR